MKKEPPVSVSIFPWLKNNLGHRCGAPLTSTDRAALMAAVQVIALYAMDHSPALIPAFAAVVLKMQPQCRELAYHAIAHVMDWHDRPRIWSLAGLPDMPVSRCQFEP